LLPKIAVKAKKDLNPWIVEGKGGYELTMVLH
jgi:hypothetical protein